MGHKEGLMPKYSAEMLPNNGPIPCPAVIVTYKVRRHRPTLFTYQFVVARSGLGILAQILNRRFA